MSNISSLYTPQAAQGSAIIGQAGTNLAMNKSALGQTGSFLDVLFAALMMPRPTQDMAMQMGTDTAKTSDQPMTDPTDLEQIQVGDTTQKLNDDTLASLQGQLLLLAQHQANTSGTTGGTTNAADIQAINDLRAQLAALNSTMSQESTPDAAVSSSPWKDLMAAMQEAEKISATQNNQPFTQLATMQLTAPVLPETKAATPIVVSTDPNASTPITDSQIAAQLNAMDVGGDGTGAAETGEDKSGLPQWLQNLITGGSDQSYTPMLKTDAGAYQGQHLPTGDKTKTIMQTVLGLFGIGTPAQGTTGTFSAATIEMGSINSDPITGYSQNLLHPHNTQIHQAQGSEVNLTQAVALQLQNMAGNRETRSLTVQLNPPELGRMQVKMSYGRDKTVKADIAVEKPDTLSMLQKDTDSLRDALQQAGLNADAGSLNLSLAGEGAFADHMRDDGNQNLSKAVNDNDLNLVEIQIRSSEEWSVDPKTGITRYNIYA